MTAVNIPTASKVIHIIEPLRSLGSPLTQQQLEALDMATDSTKEVSK
jgi:hypothetical protein